MRSEAENPADDRTTVELVAYRVKRGDQSVTVTQDDEGKWRLSGRAVSQAADVVRSVDFKAASPGDRVGPPTLFAFRTPQSAQHAAAQLLDAVVAHQGAFDAADAELVDVVRSIKPPATVPGPTYNAPTLSVASGKD